jgi:hypothetical protein
MGYVHCETECAPFYNNKHMAFFYKTKIGAFFIRRLTEEHWGLLFEEKVLGLYGFPASAAESVYKQTTGHSEWDTLEQARKPHNISEWKEVC